MPRLSVVLPCYNESGNLPEILSRYRPLAAPLDLELVLVDNGSTDGSARILADALARPENAFARTVPVERNVGYGHGLKAGLREARGERLAISHADLQCRPEDLRTASEFFDLHGPEALVKGRRKGFRAPADRMVTWCYNRLAQAALGLKLAGGGALDVNAEPKLFSRSLLSAVLVGPDDFMFDLYVLWAAARKGYAVVEFDVSYEARRWGQSKLAANPWMRLRTSLKAAKTIIELRRNQ